MTIIPLATRWGGKEQEEEKDHYYPGMEEAHSSMAAAYWTAGCRK